MSLLRRVIPVGLLMVLLLPSAASAATVNVSAMDNFFSPVSVTINPGDTVHWTNEGVNPHTSTGDHPFDLWDSGTLMSGDTFDFVFTAAGRYRYHCDFHVALGMVGTVAVRVRAFPPSGPVGTIFTIRVATVDAAPPFVYDIQKKDPGGTWQNWMTGVTTRDNLFDSAGMPTGTYQFRSRLRNTSSGLASQFSPPKSISVTP